MPGPAYNVELVRNMAPPKKIRSPNNPFSIRYKPFEIQPFYLMPVLPGETLKNLSLQASVVSDPIRNKLAGWWLEYYFFYVKIRDLDGRDDFEEMFINPTLVGTTVGGGAYDGEAQNYKWYHPGTAAFNWTKFCTKRVVEEYFRGEGEAWDAFTFASGLPIAQVSSPPGWMDSLMAADDFAAEEVTVSTAGDDAFGMSEWEDAWQKWSLARANNLVQMSFEDYLAMSGVGGAATEEPHIPELLRYIRLWTSPNNTVEPTTGVPSTAITRIVQERLDKAKFFPEPGFILGCAIARPKVYYNLLGSASHFMHGFRAWLPPQLRNDPRVAQQGFNAATGPAADGLDTEGYRISFDDVLLFGDQFMNFDPDPATEDFGSTVSLPIDGTNLINSRYITETDANRLFVDEGGDPGTALLIRSDGIVSAHILSNLRNSIEGVAPSV